MDTAEALVRLMGMNEQRTNVSTRLLATGVAVALVAAAGVFVTSGDASTTESPSEVTVAQTPTTAIAVEEASVELVEPLTFPLLDEASFRSCLSEVDGGSVLAVEFSDKGMVRAAEVSADGELVEVSIGDELGANGYLVMSTMPQQGDPTIDVSVWFAHDGLTQDENTAFEIVDCVDDDEDMVVAAMAAHGVERPGSAGPLLASGSTCFANRADHPGADWIRIDVNDDVGALYTARYDDSDGISTLETGSGSFVNETALALDLQQQGQPSDYETRRTEVFTVEDGGITFGLGFFSEVVDCAEVNPLLAELELN